MMKLNFLIYGILALVVTSTIFISWYIIIPKPGSDMNGSTEPSYVFEPNWWLKPQTFGMFNYWGDTNYARLEATNCTANGYRLVYDFDFKNSEFDYQKDVDEAYEKARSM